MEFLSEIIRRERFLIEDGSHKRDSVIIVLEGRFSFSIGSEQHMAEPYDICVFHRETVFRRRVLEPLRCVYLQFEKFPVELTDGKLPTADPERARNTIDHLSRAVQAENRELTAHYLRDLYFLNKYRDDNHGSEDGIVAACVALLEREYARRISLDTLCRQYAISKQGLIRKFRRHTGKTPVEYLLAVRLSQSKRLLRDTNLSVGQVAERCGFENVYYFSNFFKRSTGETPTNYRKLLDI